VTARAEAGTRAGIALFLVVALALVLRLWGIHYGLPWLFYFHDEPQVVLRALRFGTGDFNPHFFLWPGTLLIEVAFLSYGGLFLVGRGLGWWSGREGFAAAYFRDPSPFYLLARFQSVVLGTWSVWLANGLGRAAYSAEVGLAAALGLAVNAMAAHYAHLAHPVTAMTAFTVLGLWSAVRLANGGPPRALLHGALATGFGMAAQYHAGLLVVPIGVAVALRAAESAGAERGRWLVRGAGAGVLALVVFLALSPYVALDAPAFRADLAWITAKTNGALGGTSRGSLAGLVAFARECVRPALGIPLALAAMAGVLLALLRRTRSDLVLLSFGAAYLLLVSRAGVLNDRYAIPLVVPALVLAARAIGWALAGLRVAEGRSAWAVPAIVVLLCTPPALELIESDVTMTRTDTRIESLRWFETHVPAGSRVVIDMMRFWNTSSPPLAEDSTRLRERLAEAEGGFTGAGHSSAYADFYRHRLQHPHAPAYYLRSTDLGDSTRTLDEYRREGFRWAVVSEDAVRMQASRAAAGDSSGIRYYLSLERAGDPVAEFRPERWRRRGPVIRIYRLDRSGSHGS
jgi:hypothetical protein